ncbi:MAG: helix-turn-helix domain-containing protein [Armatimonadetes bacterium]|nr:helix-turn-helix domain-containing protein [Armatimonadota bacterium]
MDMNTQPREAEWTLQEERQLSHLHNKGLTPRAIADQLGRTPEEVRDKIEELGHLDR